MRRRGGPRCRSTCRRVSTSKRSTAGRGPSRGSGRPSRPSSGSPTRGRFNTPTLISNWTQFTSTFGDFAPGTYLAHAVFGYFMNGGGNCYVVRIGDDGNGRRRPRRDRGRRAAGGAGQPAAGRRGRREPAPGRAGDRGRRGGEAPTDDMFKLVVKRGGQVVEEFDRADHQPRQAERRDHRQRRVQDHQDRGRRQPARSRSRTPAPSPSSRPRRRPPRRRRR